MSHNVVILLLCLAGLAGGCAGKYTVKSYPSDAKLFIKDFKTNEKKLVGTTPVSINEDIKLGDVFFMVLEKENYKPKEIMVKVNEGESLLVAATMDPIAGGEGDGSLAKKDDKDKPPPGQPKKDDKPKDWEIEIADMKLRIALLENTTAFYKDALFSPRLAGGQPANERDRRDTVVSYVFQAQQNVAQGKNEDALEKINKALQLDEYSTNAWMMKGSIKYLTKDYMGAKLAWEQALKLDPFNKVVFKYLNTAYRMLNLEPMTEDPASLRYPASPAELRKKAKGPNVTK